MKEFVSQEAAIRQIEKHLHTLRVAECAAEENARHRPECCGFDRPTYETALASVAEDIRLAISYITDEDIRTSYQERFDQALAK